jgi:regulator of sigma E protease
MLTLVVFILILFVSVMVHELAHYFNARSAGIPVRAFSIGMGPILWRRQWRGTEWRLAAIPLGGYVDLPGLAPKVAEDGTLHHSDEGMAVATLPRKLWVLSGGVIANFILGVLLITTVLMLQPELRTITSGITLATGTEIISVPQGSLGAGAGLQAGDRITGIDGLQAPEVGQVIAAVQGTGSVAPPEPGFLNLTVLRDGTEQEIRLAWPPAGNEPALLGITLGAYPLEDLSVPLGTAFLEAASFSIRAVPEMVGGFVRGFGSALTGQRSDEITGPIGIIGAVNQATRVGVAPVLLLAALINLSLAVFNLLPIPGLDGGRMLLAVITSIRGRPFRPGQEEAFHFIGIMAVLLLIVLITFGDISRFLGG